MSTPLGGHGGRLNQELCLNPKSINRTYEITFQLWHNNSCLVHQILLSLKGHQSGNQSRGGKGAGHYQLWFYKELP